jgi:hypothetical protein
MTGRPRFVSRRVAVQRPNRWAVPPFARANGLLLGIVGIFSGIMAIQLPSAVSQDTWLSVLAGKTIRGSGLPRRDPLMSWTLGQTWVDQQWLAHLLSYALFSIGGVVLLALCHVLFVTAGVAAAVAFSRRRGVTTRAIAWTAAVTFYPVLVAVNNVRTQTFVTPLFVLVLALLIADVAHPSRRVLAVMPIIALWGNLHGSVVVGVALVVLRAGVASIHRRQIVRALAVASGAVVSMFVTPFGLRLLGYYDATLFNSSLRRFVTEWQPLAPSRSTAPIYVLVVVVTVLMVRYAREAGLFESLAAFMLLALALLSERNVLWLGLGSLILLAKPLDRAFRSRDFAARRLNAAVGLVGFLLAGVALLAVVVRGSQGLLRAFPTRAAQAVSAATSSGGGVYSSERFADWLVLEHPSLEGRVAYDARFELLSETQLRRISAWRNPVGKSWMTAAAHDRVIVLDLPGERAAAELLLAGHMHEAFRDEHVVVLVRDR